jgi:CheY-like chemotaxis protein
LTEGVAQGLRLLVVEDEAMIAMAMEDMLTDLGCIVVDVAGSLAQALNRLDGLADGLDGAILDVNLGGGETVYPVADALAVRGVPFIFATGYGAGGLDQRYRHTQILAKPVGLAVLRAALTQFGRIGGATA